MTKLSPVVFCLTLILSGPGLAQTDITRSAELGALLTSGNTDEQNLNFGAEVEIDQTDWDYLFSVNGLYAESENVVKAQRVVGIARVNYEITEYSFFQTRASHEDDRFNGFDSQSDLTFSYGHDFLLNQPTMDLSLVGGIGARYSRLEDGSTKEEPILRLAGEYDWNLSESALFSQDLSVDAGSNSDIYRSETSIETQILGNLSLRFAVRIRHQTEVPVGRKNTDTQTAITFNMEF
ncbi:unnamed protein product [Discosporangium mesarthrocarpum]